MLEVLCAHIHQHSNLFVTISNSTQQFPEVFSSAQKETNSRCDSFFPTIPVLPSHSSTLTCKEITSCLQKQLIFKGKSKLFINLLKPNWKCRNDSLYEIPNIPLVFRTKIMGLPVADVVTSELLSLQQKLLHFTEVRT